MLRRCRRFLLLALCVFFLVRYYDLPSRSQSSNHSATGRLRQACSGVETRNYVNNATKL